MSSPPRGFLTLQSKLLAEVRAYDATALRRVEAVRVTTLAGEQQLELRPSKGTALKQLPPTKTKCSTHEQDGLTAAEEDTAAPLTPQAAAIAKLAALRKAAKADGRPARVAEGLYVGGIGAAHNLKALRKAGITHIVNASPVVPCFFRDNPENAFHYLVLPLYDDAAADLAPHLAAAQAFISDARAAGGRVLVHCFAGQSRSAALLIGHLMASRRLGLLEAWAAVRAARPVARPNPGFLAQLAAYGRALKLEGAEADAQAIEGLDLDRL